MPDTSAATNTSFANMGAPKNDNIATTSNTQVTLVAR
jgi:hypothetical protein